ncbi:MAG TPA: TlyA family RNA methyltransferase [Desulfobacteraceae bacterium]|nr:TlyA family RNA methyltransferase [Desulfobacteraceae bacterium]HDO30402.1 TlyA family RNA methyltransferase [Desulfobacteraceae bacterium]
MKKRLDGLLVARGLAEDTAAAQALIGAGAVLVNGLPGAKAGSRYGLDCSLELKKKQAYVSRGGGKLAAGLREFALDPAGLICADIGCSTGGFTDCLLQRGARRVYCVDVGYGVLAWKLRQDERVVVLERTNARFLTREQIPESLDLAVIDASFISLGLLLGPLCGLFHGRIRMVVLVKPQFELPRQKVARGGVVREGFLHEEALEMVRGYVTRAGLTCKGVVASPVRGAKGNQEFLMYLTAAAPESRQSRYIGEDNQGDQNEKI